MGMSPVVSQFLRCVRHMQERPEAQMDGGRLCNFFGCPKTGSLIPTVDGRNPAPPGMYKTL